MADKHTDHPAETPEFTKLTPAFRPVRPELEFQYEHFCGRGSDEVLHGAEGCRLTADVVLARFSRVDSYTLAIRLGDRWFELARVGLDDPALADLPLIEHPPSPHEVEQQRRKDQADAERLAAEKEHRLERQRLAEERRRKAEEHQARVVEENRRRMGV